MTDIIAAQDRLQRALARLESAQRALIQRRAQAAPVANASPSADLIASLEAVQKENNELSTLAQAIGARLDKTINRIETLLAEDDAGDGERA